MTKDVIVQFAEVWPVRCTKCRSDIVTMTKQAWQECDQCGRLWVDPQSVDVAVGAGKCLLAT